MNQSELETKTTVIKTKNLEEMSIQGLQEYIVELEMEINRAKDEIDKNIYIISANKIENDHLNDVTITIFSKDFDLIAVILGSILYCSPWFKNSSKKKANIKLIKGPARTMSDFLYKEIFSKKFRSLDLDFS